MVKNVKNKQQRKFRPVDEKTAILRRHLIDKVPVSDLCDEYGIQPSVFYSWQKQLFDNAGLALEAGAKKADARVAQLQRQNDVLEAKLAKKDAIIADVSEAYVTLKKQLGEL